MKNLTYILAILSFFVTTSFTVFSQDTLRYNTIKEVRFEYQKAHEIIVSDSVISFVMDNISLDISVRRLGFISDGILYGDDKFGYQYLWRKGKQILIARSPMKEFTHYYLNR